MANGFLLRSLPFAASDGPSSVVDPPTVAGNAANDYMGLVYRSTVGNILTLKIDLGASPAPVDTIAALDTNIPLTGTPSAWSIFANAADSWGSPSLALNLNPPAGEALSAKGLRHGLHLFASPVTFRWWLVRINAQAGIRSQMGRVLIGRRFQPARNFQFGAERGARDLGEVRFGPRGAFLRRRGRILRTLGFSWPLMAKAEAEAEFLPLAETAGNSDFLLACLDPEAEAERTRRLYFGPIEGNPATAWRVWDGFEARVQIASVI